MTDIISPLGIALIHYYLGEDEGNNIIIIKRILGLTNQEKDRSTTKSQLPVSSFLSSSRFSWPLLVRRMHLVQLGSWESPLPL